MITSTTQRSGALCAVSTSAVRALGEPEEVATPCAVHGSRRFAHHPTMSTTMPEHCAVRCRWRALAASPCAQLERLGLSACCPAASPKGLNRVCHSFLRSFLPSFPCDSCPREVFTANTASSTSLDAPCSCSAPYTLQAAVYGDPSKSSPLRPTSHQCAAADQQAAVPDSSEPASHTEG